jgi:arylsulfatase A-like enzyme
MDAAPRPNIVVILPDDMGFSDIGLIVKTLEEADQFDTHSSAICRTMVAALR